MFEGDPFRQLDFVTVAHVSSMAGMATGWQRVFCQQLREH